MFGLDAMLCSTEGEGCAARQAIQERRGKRTGSEAGSERDFVGVCLAGELSVRMEVFYVCAVQHGGHENICLV